MTHVTTYAEFVASRAKRMGSYSDAAAQARADKPEGA